MRIVAGKFGQRKLIVPKGQDIRPTSDKIRGAIMNMLRSRGALEDAFVIDAFCGTGALGLESISQGALSCIFIDQSRESLELAKDNAKALGVVAADFILKDVTKIGAKPAAGIAQASLLFLDPPYKKDLVIPALEALHQGDWIAPSAWIVVEAEEKFMPSWPEYLTINTEKNYGDTKISLLKYNLKGGVAK